MSEEFKKELTNKVMRAFRKAVKAELLEHKRLGNPIYVSDKKGGIKKLSPAQIKF